MSIDAKYGMQVHQGFINDHRPFFKFGYNPDISTTEETIWEGGGIYNYPASATIMKVSSANAADTSTVVIYGLDANYNEISESVTITGQTAVNTTQSFLRVYRAQVIANAPIGIIYIGTGVVTAGVPANIYAKITAGENQTLMAVYTVPAGHTAYLFMGTVSCGTSTTNKYTTVRLKIREYGQVFCTKAITTIQNSFNQYDFGIPLAIPEKSDMEARGITSSGTDSISATFSMVLVKDI